MDGWVGGWVGGEGEARGWLPVESLPARPARWAADAAEMGTVRREAIPRGAGGGGGGARVGVRGGLLEDGRLVCGD